MAKIETAPGRSSPHGTPADRARRPDRRRGHAAAVLANTLGAPPDSATGYLQWLLEHPAAPAALWFAAVACWIAATRRTVPAAGTLAFGVGPLLLETYLLSGSVQFLVSEYLAAPPGVPLAYGPLVDPWLWLQRAGAAVLFVGSFRLVAGDREDGPPDAPTSS